MYAEKSDGHICKIKAYKFTLYAYCDNPDALIVDTQQTCYNHSGIALICASPIAWKKIMFLYDFENRLSVMLFVHRGWMILGNAFCCPGKTGCQHEK